MTPKLRLRAFLLALLALLLTSVPARADALLTFNFFGLNLTDETQLFTLTFNNTYSGGPYNRLASQFSTTVTDGGDGIVAVDPAAASGFIMVPFIDLATVGAASLGAGCTVVGLPGFADATCDPLSSVSVAVSTLTGGALGATISFLLSAGDSISGEGRLELTNVQVPEPVNALLLGLGVSIAAIRRRRSRRSA